MINGIEKVGPIGGPGEVKKTHFISDKSVEKPQQKDTIQLSEEFKLANQLSKKITKELLTTREDKIKEVKQRLESGFYKQPQIKQEIADKVMKDLYGL